MRLERAKRHVFYICLASFAIVVTLTSIALAKEYQPEAREALLIRPTLPVQRVKPPVPCLRAPERPKLITWQIRDKDGNVIIIGSQIVRQRC